MNGLKASMANLGDQVCHPPRRNELLDGVVAKQRHELFEQTDRIQIRCLISKILVRFRLNFAKRSRAEILGST